MKSARTGFFEFIIRGGDEELEASKGYFCNNRLVTDLGVQYRLETYRACKVDGVDFSRVGLGREGLLKLQIGEHG